MRKNVYLFSFILLILSICVHAWAAPFAYITNNNSNDVSVIDMATNTVVGSPIPVGTNPSGVAINSAGTRVYVANTDVNNVSVIDTATCTVIGSPIPVGTKPWSVAVNPSGTRVYVANLGSNNVSVIDTATNTVTGSPIPVGASPWGVAVNPSGTRVYVANLGSNNVSVIDTTTDTVIGPPIPVGASPMGVAVNPASTRVYITNYGSNNVSIIDTATNTVTGSPIPVGTNPWGVAVNPAGTRVYVANHGSGEVSIIDTATNTVIGSPKLRGTNPVGVAVNPAGTWVYVAQTASRWVSVIDTATNTVVGLPIAVGINPHGVAVNPAGTKVYVTNSGSDNVSVIDTTTNTVTGSPIPVGTNPIGVAVNPSGTRVYVTNNGSNNVSVIDTATNTVTGSTIPVGASPMGVAVNPAGTQVYVVNHGSGDVSVIDTTNNTVPGSPIPVGTGPMGVVVNPAGTRVYVTNNGSNNVSVIDTTTDTVIGSPIPVGTVPIGVAINSAGTRVYVANFGSNNVSVIDTATNTVTGSTIPVGTSPFGVAVNSAGTRVYVANFGSGDVSVIDTTTNTVIGSPKLGGTNPVGVAVNPAGTWVYVAQAASNRVSVIDTATNTVIGPPILVGEWPQAFGQFIVPQYGPFRRITNIKEFLKTCPQNDPAYQWIRSDFIIRRNGIVVEDIPCTEPASEMPLSQFSDELIMLQSLRVIYYMDSGQSGHLPWTPGTLYAWMKSKIGGFDIQPTGGISACCNIYDGKFYPIISTIQNDYSRDLCRGWKNISAMVAGLAHEVRHLEYRGHQSCCGIPGGCDQTFDLSNLSTFGVQWWLFKSWLMGDIGDINVGLSCLSPPEIQDIANWQLFAANDYIHRFCDNKPPELTLPDNPGGECQEPSPQSLQSFPFKDDFSMDKDWYGYKIGGWERGPAKTGGSENGNPDPGIDYSSSADNNILGFAIGADYTNGLPEEPIISPPIDCTGQDKVFLRFRRYLNIESIVHDHARIYVSINGINWTQVWENPPVDLMDSQWVPFVLDISSVAANQGTVYIKFTMGTTNSSRRFSGWNIDDFEVTFINYIVTVQVEGDLLGGSVTPSNRTVTHGYSAIFTVTTNTGYTASVSEGTLVGSTWTIPNVTSSHTATVTFTINTYTLTVTKSGTGSGTVMSSLPGIICGSDCTENYNHGTQIMLTAVPSVDSVFVGWSGACGGLEACAILMDATKAASATFIKIQLFPFLDDFSSDKGWLGYEPGAWERGPAISGGGENGYPDPGVDYSNSGDNNILGFAIGADYPNDLAEKSITSPPLDCTGQDEVFLKFRRYLNVEGNGFDHAKVYVSANGTDWTQVWENPPIDLMDSQWVPFVLDISSIAANQATVYIKFTMGPTNSSRRFSGWNIDDLEVTSEAVFPSEGTYGTELLISGSGFGMKKGKVSISSTALTVSGSGGWMDDLIKGSLKKVMSPRIYDVVVQPVGPKGTPSIIYKEAFVVRPAEIHSIERGEGSAYDQVTITGKFFGEKKGAVYLECEKSGSLESVRKSCTVSDWDMDPTTGDSEIVFVVPVILPAVCDVIVDPYSTIAATEEEDGFSVKEPEIESVDPKTGSVGEQITISGNFFGSKKPKVYLGYMNVKNGKYTKKSCSVSSWPTDPTKEEGEIVFKVPTGLLPGPYDVIVTNSVGSDTLPGGFIIE